MGRVDLHRLGRGGGGGYLAGESEVRACNVGRGDLQRLGGGGGEGRRGTYTNIRNTEEAV